MIFFVLILLLVIFNKIEFAGENQFFKNEYLDKHNTTAINGIFVILIIFSHYTQYNSFEGNFNMPYLILREHLNQMVVATFLFYSGYGMMEAIKKNGNKYLNKIPVKFIKLLIRLDLAVCAFLLMRWLFNMGCNYDSMYLLKTFIGWESVGNSNWYIFVILVMYILMCISFALVRFINACWAKYVSILLLLILTVGFVYFMMKAGRDMYWYDTVILLPLGMLYSMLKDRVEQLVMHNDFFYCAIAVVVTGAYIILYYHRWDYGIEGYTLWAIAFIAIVLLVTMKVKICNPVLEWFGKHVFSIYILQRIPMMILYKYGCIDNHPYVSLLTVIVTTAFIAIVFEYLTDKLFELPHACKRAMR